MKDLLIKIIAVILIIGIAFLLAPILFAFISLFVVLLFLLLIIKIFID